MAFLAEKARSLHSPMLAALAARAGGGADPFAKVRSIINDLIATLSEQAKAEVSQKSQCDTDMAAALEKRDRYQAEMESSAASIDATKAEIATLKTEIAALSAEVADLHKAVNDMTELRTEEKADNERTIKDATQGAEDIKQAIAVLTQFYGQEGLVQLAYVPPKADRENNTVADLAPETFTGTYTGKVTESKGVLGLLEVIQSDFERTVSTTQEADTAAEEEFKTQSELLEGQIKEKEAAKSTKETDVQTKESALTGFEDDLRSQTKLHAGALTELEKLKTSCVDGEESYEQRRQKRQQEIDALKSALQILDGWKN